MSPPQQGQVTPLKFYLDKTWKITDVRGDGVGMGGDQRFEFRVGATSAALQLELDPLRAFETKPDWATSFGYNPDEGTLTADFATEGTKAIVSAHGDHRISCRITPFKDERPGEWEAQEEG